MRLFPDEVTDTNLIMALTHPLLQERMEQHFQRFLLSELLGFMTKTLPILSRILFIVRPSIKTDFEKTAEQLAPVLLLRLREMAADGRITSVAAVEAKVGAAMQRIFEMALSATEAEHGRSVASFEDELKEL